MAQVSSLISKFTQSWRWFIYACAGAILLVWLMATPEGVLGKADAVGYAFCHRIDLRSFHIGARQLPLCARCTGQYLGAVIGLASLSIYSRRRSGIPSKKVMVVLGLLLLAFFVDGLNSFLYLPPILSSFPHLPHLYEPSNTLRLITGTGMGLVIAMLLYPAFIGSVYTDPNPAPVVTRLEPVIILIGIGAVVDIFILTGVPAILIPAALVSTGGLLLLLIMVYSVISIYLLRKVNKYQRLAQAVFPITLGFIIAMIQIAAIDIFRYALTGTWSGGIFK